MIVTPNIAYLGPGRKHKLDLYEPRSPGRHPGVVVIHGGGWRVGDKQSDREVQMAETLTAAGYVCVSINYMQIQDQSPPWPTYLHDARHATDWLRARSNVVPDRIGAIGGSAGGNMSLLLGVADEGFKPIQAVVALYPPTDMAWVGKDRTELFGHTIDERPDIARSASPLFLATADFPPTLMIHGTADKVVHHDQSERLAARLKELGVEHQLIIADGLPHTFKLSGESHDFRDEVVGFFDRHLRR